jgi:hypothetical protein
MDAKRLVFLSLIPLLACSCAQPVARPAAIVTPPMPAPSPVHRPAEQTITLGQSVENRPIVMHVFGDGDGPGATLVLAAIHGNEPTSATVARALLEYLRQNPASIRRGRVAILPVANPDGLARKLRTNKNLVDLNRNFPAANWAKTRKGVYFGGDRASSEPETLALLSAFDQIRPARVVSIHSMDKPCNNYDGPAKPLAELMSQRNGYVVKDNIGYPTPGSLGSWAGADRGIPIITLELPRTLAGDKAWEQNRDALLAAIRGVEPQGPRASNLDGD